MSNTRLCAESELRTPPRYSTPRWFGNTAADGPARLLLLQEVVESADTNQRKIATDALIAGSATDHFSRSVGSETHGSRPALASWHPATREEALTYIEGCVDLLVEFATGDDDVAAAARVGLGRNLRSLVSSGFIDLVETIVDRVGATCDSWPEASQALSDFLSYQGKRAEPNIIGRVRCLMESLVPEELDARVRFLVTEMSWDYLCEEEDDLERRFGRQVDAVRDFADELTRQPDTLRGLLPQQRLSMRHYKRIARCYKAILEQGRSEMPQIPPRKKGQRGPLARSDAHNLHQRLVVQRKNVLRSTRRADTPFTNNRSERDIRMAKVKQKVSGCFRTVSFAHAYCRISCYLQTMAALGYNPLVATTIALHGNAVDCLNQDNE